MQDHFEKSSEAITQGGAAVTGISLSAHLAGLTEYFDAHSGALLVYIALFGAAISFCSFIIGWWYKDQRRKNELRDKIGAN